jgi:2-polyprenyl-3-methyl-5-hydroxy-6-metoxy-1,4-benzoquinol methylase
MKKLVHTQCISCHGLKLSPLKGYERFNLVKCSHCHLVFIGDIPSTEELNAHYSKYSYGSARVISPITIKSYHALLDEFEPFRQHNKILDVGCGLGSFLVEAKKRGWEVYGTEYSPTAVKLCQDAGIMMYEGVLNPSDFDPESFDVITSFEVIEHINNPNDDIQSIYSVLRKGGLFYCTTPNFNSLLRYYLNDKYDVICYPEHLAYYTKRTLIDLLLRHQFSLQKFYSTGISITRIKNSIEKNKESLKSEHSSDELLRKNIEKKWYLGLLKKVVNNLLTLTNTGITLKGYFIK